MPEKTAHVWSWRLSNWQTHLGEMAVSRIGKEGGEIRAPLTSGMELMRAGRPPQSSSPLSLQMRKPRPRERGGLSEVPELVGS